MRTNLALSSVGRRFYVDGATDSMRTALESAGCHWDAQSRRWWIGAMKRAHIQSVVNRLNTPPPPTPSSVVEDMDATPVYATVAYRGHIYYQVDGSADGSRLCLANLRDDCVIWVDRHRCQAIKTCWPVKDNRGRIIHSIQPTIGQLRRLAARKRNLTRRSGTCCECGAEGPLRSSCPQCRCGEID